MPEPTPDRPGPLDGLRVLDLTQNLAGPYCTMLLADLGADVIKVEPPAGDGTRRMGPYTPEDTERAYGGYFASVNRGKRSIVLDLKDPVGRQTLLDLVPTVDVLVENGRAGVMDRLGLGYEALAAVNAKLVYAAIRGFGDPRTGESPYVTWPAYDIVAQAMGGLVSMTGTAEGTVMKCGPSVGDLYSGALNAVGLLAAVIDAQRTGVGQFVDVAMYDAVLSLTESAVYRYSCSDVVPGPTGNGHPQIAPFDIFPTADGNCGIGAPGDMFAQLCALMGRPELAEDERFATFGDRLANRPALNAEIVAWTSTRTTADYRAPAGRGGRGRAGERHGGRLERSPRRRPRHAGQRGAARRQPSPHPGRPADQNDQERHRGAARPPRLNEHAAAIMKEAGLEQ